MLSAYTGVKILVTEKPQWLQVIRACYQQAGEMEAFAGAWVRQRLGGWFPSLRTLTRYGILEKIETTRGGRRAYYRMPNREEVGRALEELENREIQITR